MKEMNQQKNNKYNVKTLSLELIGSSSKYIFFGKL